MKIVIVGFGVQGQKRQKFLKNLVVGIVDPLVVSQNTKLPFFNEGVVPSN